MDENSVAEAELEDRIGSLFVYYRNVVASVWPKGAMLRCPRCGRTQTATVGQLANHLARGWPTCHGETMHVGDAEGN